MRCDLNARPQLYSRIESRQTQPSDAFVPWIEFPQNPRSLLNVSGVWLHYKLLKILEENPDVTQRELAARLGISLVGRGWVKKYNFPPQPNKMGQVYLLAPSGIEKKARFAVSFLWLKLH